MAKKKEIGETNPHQLRRSNRLLQASQKKLQVENEIPQNTEQPISAARKPMKDNTKLKRKRTEAVDQGTKQSTLPSSSKPAANANKVTSSTKRPQANPQKKRKAAAAAVENPVAPELKRPKVDPRRPITPKPVKDSQNDGNGKIRWKTECKSLKEIKPNSALKNFSSTKQPAAVQPHVVDDNNIEDNINDEDDEYDSVNNRHLDGNDIRDDSELKSLSYQTTASQIPGLHLVNIGSLSGSTPLKNPNNNPFQKLLKPHDNQKAKIVYKKSPIKSTPQLLIPNKPEERKATTKRPTSTFLWQKQHDGGVQTTKIQSNMAALPLSSIPECTSKRPPESKSVIDIALADTGLERPAWISPKPRKIPKSISKSVPLDAEISRFTRFLPPSRLPNTSQSQNDKLKSPLSRSNELSNSPRKANGQTSRFFHSSADVATVFEIMDKNAEEAIQYELEKGRSLHTYHNGSKITYNSQKASLQAPNQIPQATVDEADRLFSFDNPDYDRDGEEAAEQSLHDTEIAAFFRANHMQTLETYQSDDNTELLDDSVHMSTYPEEDEDEDEDEDENERDVAAPRSGIKPKSKRVMDIQIEVDEYVDEDESEISEATSISWQRK